MIEIIDKIMDVSWINQFRKLFYRKIALLFALIITSIAAFFIAPYVKSTAKELELFVYSPSYFYMGLLIFNAIIAILWHYNRKLPRVGMGKIGIVVALCCESPKIRRRIQRDFVEKLEKSFLQDPETRSFQVIQLQDYLSEHYVSLDAAKSAMNKQEYHLLIFGRVKKNNNKICFEMQGIVRHRPLRQEISNAFSQEFRLLFPEKINFEKKYKDEAYEVASESTSLVARYIVGVAALYSGELEYAEKLLEDTERLIDKGKRPFDRSMRSYLNEKLIMTYENCMTVLHYKWRDLRDPALQVQKNEYAKKILNRNPIHYSALIQRAIWQFVKFRNVTEAKKCLRPLDGIKDATYLYNFAFLFAYEQNFSEALRYYSMARKEMCAEHIVIEIEEFLCWIIEMEPDKVYLKFFLGLINLHKPDDASAKREFEEFLSESESGQYPSLQAKATKFLEDIKTRSDQQVAKAG